MFKTSVFVTLFASLTTASAQQISNQIINSTGGFGQVFGNYSVEYAVGEPITTTLSEPSMTLTQGFLQPEIRLIIPVELVFFNARLRDEQTAQLTWETRSELNADYFSVEKSLNTVDFTPIGQVKAAGNSTKKQDYFYDDTLLSSEKIIYYRLKQVDVNGAFKYTKIAAVYVPTTDKQGQIKVYPNPARYNITIESIKPIKSVNIYTIQGILIAKSVTPDINISDYAAGIYVLEVENTEGGISRVKFIKLL